MGNEQQPQQQYSQPATFVGTKRVRTGEKDSKGRDKTVLTFGLGKTPNGTPKNDVNDLIAALLPYADKQVNFAIHIEEKTSAQGRKFPSAFVKITEMIPKDEGGGQTQYVPKTNTRTADIKAKAEGLRNKFENKV